MADTVQEWNDALESLYISRNLRIKMGQQGKEKVHQQYSIQHTAPKLLELLKKRQSHKYASISVHKSTMHRLLIKSQLFITDIYLAGRDEGFYNGSVRFYRACALLSTF